MQRAQHTMLQYKDLTVIGSNNYEGVHVELIVVLPDLINPVGWTKRSVPNIHLATVFLNEIKLMGEA